MVSLPKAFLNRLLRLSSKSKSEGKILKGEERKLFEVERIKLDVKLAELKNYKK